MSDIAASAEFSGGGPYELMLRGKSGSEGFLEFHKDPYNTALHLVTTPFAIVAAICAINALTKASRVPVSATLCVGYTAALAVLPHYRLPCEFADTIVYCAVAMAGMACLASICDFSLYVSVPLMVLGYVGQDVAHLLSGEKTFQSTYESEDGALGMLFQHTFYLLPLVFEAAKPFLDRVAMLGLAAIPGMLVGMYHSLNSEGGVFPWEFCPARVLHTKLRTKEDLADLATVRQFAMDSNPSRTTSSHWWYEKAYDMKHSLNETARQAFQNIAEGDQMMGTFKAHFNDAYYTTETVPGMNELYCTGPAISKADSDTVFYTKHIDGPYGMIPFASLYRCIMASDSNTQISTIFPMTGQYITAADGDAVCFDFHRENHFIQSDNTRRNQDLRVVLKLHYVVYPKWARPIGQLMHYLSVKYNENFRALFLFTIQPKTIVARITAWNVVFWTVVVEKTWTHVGLQNVVYVLAVMLASWFCDSRALFLVATSFVHPIRHLTTCFTRSNVDFGVYKRDVILFKTLAALQLAYYYAYHYHTAIWNARSELVIKPGWLPVTVVEHSLTLIVLGIAVAAIPIVLLGADSTCFHAQTLGFSKAGLDGHQLRHLVTVGECLALLGSHLVLIQHGDCENLPETVTVRRFVPAQLALIAAGVVQDVFKITKARLSVPTQPVAVMHEKVH